MENTDEIVLEDKAQDTVEVTETDTKDKVDLSNVEVMSNGQMVDVSKTEEEKPKDAEQQQQEQPKVEETDTAKDYKQTKDDINTAKEELNSKGLDVDKLEKEYLEKGELSEASINELKKAGYSEAIIKATLAGWQASADRFVDTVIQNVGGKEAFNNMTKFVQGLGNDAIDAFNAIMETGDMRIIKAHIDGIKAQMVAKYGTSNPTLTGGNAKPNTQGFSNWEAVTKAMSDPRYGRNAAYTKAVEEKLAKSNI